MKKFLRSENMVVLNIKSEIKKKFKKTRAIRPLSLIEVADMMVKRALHTIHLSQRGRGMVVTRSGHD